MGPAICSEWPAISASEVGYARTRRERGVRVSSAPGNGLIAPLLAAGLMVLHSTWDCHRNVAAFSGWLLTLEQRGVKVLRPPTIVRWNLDKR